MTTKYKEKAAQRSSWGVIAAPSSLDNSRFMKVPN
jgi:hypothetical protein